MPSQQHNTFNWPEEEAPPSSTQEQTTPAAFSWRGWSLWLRIIGVIVALVASFAFMFLPIPNAASWNLFLLLVVLVGVVSAALVRSWWSLLMVPVAFDLGHALSEGLQYGFDTFFLSLVWGAVLLFIVLVEIDVAIGTPLGKMIEKRLRH